MLKNLSEKSLLRLQLIGMLTIALCTAIGLGGYFTLTYIFKVRENLVVLEAHTLERQEEILRQETLSIFDQLDYTRGQTEEVLKRRVKEYTDSAYQLARSIYEQQSGRMPDEEIKNLIVETLRPQRFFEGRGYYFIDQLDGLCVLLPTAPKLEGTSFWDNQDPTGHYIMRGLVAATQNPAGAGYSRYQWYPPSEPNRMREKISYVRRFAPFDWVIGTGEYLFQIEDDLKRQMLSQLRSKRFDRDGYIMVLDLDGTVLLSPFQPWLEGENVEDLTGESRKTMTLLLDKAKEGGGTLRYGWFRPGETRKVRKFAKVELYEPWNWVVVTGVYLDDLDDRIADQMRSLKDEVSSQIHTMILVVSIVILVSICFSYFFSRWLHSLSGQYQNDLEEQNRLLQENEERLRLSAQVFENGNEGIMITDQHNKIIAVNPAFSEVTGYEREEVVGQNPSMFGSRRQGPAFYKAMWRDLMQSGRWSGEIWNRRKDGTLYPEWLNISVVRGERGEITNFIGTFSDITQRKEAEEKIRELAYYDPLTRLPNRRLVRDRLQQALEACLRSRDCGALLIVDLDNFKTLNDTRGHDVGDLLLVEVAGRLRSCVQGRDTVGRLGGDEFVVLLEGLGDTTQEVAAKAEKVGNRILKVLNEVYNLDGYEYHGTPSIGICLYLNGGETAEELLKRADTAMYQAKADGRNTLRFFDPDMQAELIARTAMEEDLRHALPEGQLELFYQAQVEEGRGMVGAEVLLRWRHPERGMVSPGAFIPLAEQNGMIIPLGHWVLEQACGQIKAWETDPLLSSLQLSVNVSALQFGQQHFVDEVKFVLQKSGIRPERLKLELTESMVFEDTEATIEKMEALKALGVGFSLDDFGTGSSSLSYLKRLPLDQLKIDQSFVRDVPENANDAVIVQTIINMAKSLGFDVIAEGVETDAQRAFLLQSGCRAYQGYFFARPVPLAEFEATVMESEPLLPA